jgi:hypothetical protein
VTLADGTAGDGVTQDVTVTITGTNDAPTVVADSTTASGGVTEDTNVSGGNIATAGAIGFQDLDLIDTHTATVAPASSTFVQTRSPSESSICIRLGALVSDW